MNLGIYLDSLNNHDVLKPTCDVINSELKSGKLNDASVFYDGVGHNPFPLNCGAFNSTDIWNFTGNLIVCSIDAAHKALNMVNKFTIFYYHGWKNEKNTLALLDLVNKPNVRTICKNESDAKDLYRRTGIKCVGISEDFKNITSLCE